MSIFKIVWRKMRWWVFITALTLFSLDQFSKMFVCDCGTTFTIEQNGQAYCTDDYEPNEDYEEGLYLSSGVRLYRSNGPIRIYRCLLTE